MKYVRRYYEDIYNNSWDDNRHFFEINKCIDHISDKLLTMDDNNKKYYCRMIVNFTFEYLGGSEDFSEVFNGKDMEYFEARVEAALEATQFLEYFFVLLSELLLSCNIKLNEICAECNLPALLPDSYTEVSFKSLHEDKIKSVKNKSTTANQQYQVLVSLLGKLGCTATKENISKFAGWLFNKSSDYIRQSASTGGSYQQKDDILIAEEFKLIGINYKNGRIKTDK